MMQDLACLVTTLAKGVSDPIIINASSVKRLLSYKVLIHACVKLEDTWTPSDHVWTVIQLAELVMDHISTAASLVIQLQFSAMEDVNAQIMVLLCHLPELARLVMS